MCTASRMPLNPVGSGSASRKHQRIDSKFLLCRKPYERPGLLGSIARLESLCPPANPANPGNANIEGRSTATVAGTHYFLSSIPPKNREDLSAQKREKRDSRAELNFSGAFFTFRSPGFQSESTESREENREDGKTDLILRSVLRLPLAAN